MWYLWLAYGGLYGAVDTLAADLE